MAAPAWSRRARGAARALARGGGPPPPGRAAPAWSRRARVAARALARVVVPQPAARPTTATTGRPFTAAGEGGAEPSPLSRSGFLGAVAPKLRNVGAASAGAGSTSHSPTRA